MSRLAQGLSRGTRFVAAPLALALVAGGVAYADEKDDKARAQQLFLEGRKAIDGATPQRFCVTSSRPGTSAYWPIALSRSCSFSEYS